MDRKLQYKQHSESSDTKRDKRRVAKNGKNDIKLGLKSLRMLLVARDVLNVRTVRTVTYAVNIYVRNK